VIKVFIFIVLAYSIVGVDALPNINNVALFKQNIDRSSCHVLINTHAAYPEIVNLYLLVLALQTQSLRQ
jgi:hypothetical protein